MTSGLLLQGMDGWEKCKILLVLEQTEGLCDDVNNNATTYVCS